MPDEALSILSDPELLRIREAHFYRMERLFEGNDDSPDAFLLSGINGGSATVPGDSPESKVREALLALAKQTDALKDNIAFQPLVVEFDIYGVHFTDRIFGAEVYDVDGSWQVKTLGEDPGNLSKPDLADSPTWILAQELARAFVASGVTVPLFGLPTIASALNVAVNLFGQEILVTMMTDPEAAHSDLRTINDILCEMHRWYLSNVPTAQLQPVISWERTQPPGFGQLCGCTTQLLSPELYRDIVAHLDEELLSVYPNGGMIHLCGSHTQHIPLWRDMRPLRAVQLNDRATQDLELYFNGLRTDQVLYVNPCDGMPIEQIMKITGGNRVVIVANNVQPELIKRRS